MKKVIAILFTVIMLCGVIFGFIATSSNPFSNYIRSVLSPHVANPQRLIIPKLHVNAVVEEVGQDSQGRMDIPKHARDVPWYDLGYKPGEIGNAVIAGHYNTITAESAVFYYLDRLKPGDEMQVKT